MTADRAPFAPSPRPELRAQSLAASIRNLDAAIACIRRSAALPGFYLRSDMRAFRWLFLPAGRPLAREG